MNNKNKSNFSKRDQFYLKTDGTVVLRLGNSETNF